MNAKTFFSDRPIAYHPILAKVLGSVTAALFVSQIGYWSDKGASKDGWIWKTQDEMTDETGLSRYEQETARRIAREKGVLTEQRKGVPARLFYKIDWDALTVLIDEYQQSSMRETPNLEGGKPTNYSEITTETITETSTLLPEGEKEQEELEKQAIAEFQALPSASANTEPISISKQAIAKINQFLPYSKVSKFQRQEINRYCANDPKLLALESALGELLARRDHYGFMNVNMVLTFWGNKLNAQASATGVPDYYAALKAKQLEEKERDKDAAVNRTRASNSVQPGNGTGVFGVAAPRR